MAEKIVAVPGEQVARAGATTSGSGKNRKRYVLFEMIMISKTRQLVVNRTMPAPMLFLFLAAWLQPTDPSADSNPGQVSHKLRGAVLKNTQWQPGQAPRTAPVAGHSNFVVKVISGTQDWNIDARSDMKIAEVKGRISAISGKILEKKHTLSHISAGASMLTTLGDMMDETATLAEYGVDVLSVLSVSPSLSLASPIETNHNAVEAAFTSAKNSPGRRGKGHFVAGGAKSKFGVRQKKAQRKKRQEAGTSSNYT